MAGQDRKNVNTLELQKKTDSGKNCCVEFAPFWLIRVCKRIFEGIFQPKNKIIYSLFHEIANILKESIEPVHKTDLNNLFMNRADRSSLYCLNHNLTWIKKKKKNSDKTIIWLPEDMEYSAQDVWMTTLVLEVCHCDGIGKIWVSKWWQIINFWLNLFLLGLLWIEKLRCCQSKSLRFRRPKLKFWLKACAVPLSFLPIASCLIYTPSNKRLKNIT